MPVLVGRPRVWPIHLGLPIVHLVGAARLEQKRNKNDKDKEKVEVKVDDVAVKKQEIKKLKKKNKLTFDLDEVEEGSRIKSSH